MASSSRVAILTLAVALLTSACAPATPEDPEAAPTLTGKTLGGEYWSSLDVRGKVVLVNVWATWCAPCRSELPALEAVHEKYGGPDFEVIGVSVDSDAAQDEVRAMVERFGLSYRIVLDPGKRVTVDWKISAYPTSVLLDRRGHIAWHKRGEVHSDDPQLLRRIEAALADDKPGAEP